MRFLFPATTLLFALFATAAEARPARCVVTASSEPAYRGACDFVPGTKGSFMLAPARGRHFPGAATSLSLTIVAPGVAELRGLTREGINSRWGEARRSRRDRACWDGANFRLCVY